MPFYEYRPLSGDCEICQGRFQDLQSLSEPAHKTCPECQKPCVRVISAPMVSVKGSEFRGQERAEIQRYNQALFEKSKSGQVGLGQLVGSSDLKGTKSGPHSAEHLAHDCVAMGCFGGRSREQMEELLKQAERLRTPYLVHSTKK